MNFAHPYVLALLFVPAWLIARVWRRADRRVVLPFDHGQQRPGRGWKALIDLAESVPPILLAVAILILAGPQRLGEPRSERALTNIEFCVDISGSMTAKFGEGTRYDTSMASIDEFLVARKGDSFGLMFFGTNVIDWVPLTNDPSAVRCAPPFMKPETAPRWMSGTMVGLALREAKKVLIPRAEGDRMIILVTDGYSFDLANGNDETIARELKAENIAVYTIHVAEGEPPPELGTIASITGGEVFAAGDPAGLKSVFERIDAMRPAKIKKSVAETLDNFPPLAVAGLSTLGVALVGLLGVRYTPW